MKRLAILLTAMLISSAAYADNIVIGCSLISRYSESDVNMLLGQARSILSEREVGGIYYRYVSLKNACQTNANASRVVPVSSVLRNWLAQNGIDVNKLGKQL
jgi:hypothetical protein